MHENSARVKCVELHNKEPWVVSGLYSGDLNLYNYENGKLLKTFDVCESPVRCCKFVCSKHWILFASDDFRIRAFNYNTSAKITDFEAHSDFIRSVSEVLGLLELFNCRQPCDKEREAHHFPEDDAPVLNLSPGGTC